MTTKKKTEQDDGLVWVTSIADGWEHAGVVRNKGSKVRVSKKTAEFLKNHGVIE